MTDVPGLEFERFHNALRIMNGIDFYEMVQAGAIDRGENEHESWEAFRTDPFLWFIVADDEQQRAVWSIIQKRQPERLRA